MTRKIPVLIAGMGFLSGVTTWAAKLRSALADHPLYDVQLLHIGREQPDDCDICVQSVEAAQQFVRSLAPVIVVPNYVWDLFLTGFDPDVYCVGMCHADSEEEYYRPLNWYEPLVSQFIAVSRECTERLAERVPFRRADITTLPYGICLPPNLERAYQSNPLRIVYAGRITQPQKRVRDFVPLVEQLRKANVPFVFDIVGSGDEYSDLQHAMRSHISDGNVRFHGRISHEQMPGVWTGHDIFVQVSDFEGTSVSMLEAMAHGTVPVVTAASSGIAGVIRHEQNGFVVPVGDMAAMAASIARLATDQALLRSNGQAAHQAARSYAMESHCEQFIRVLDSTVQIGQDVKLHERYGVFSPTHPLVRQRQLIVHQQKQIARYKNRAIKRNLYGRYQALLRSKLQLFSRRRQP